MDVQSFTVNIGTICSPFSSPHLIKVLGNDNTLKVGVNLVEGEVVFEVQAEEFSVELKKGEEILARTQHTKADTPYGMGGGSHNQAKMPISMFVDACMMDADSVTVRKLSTKDNSPS